MAMFAPETTKKITMADQYFCFVEALQYIYVRNFEKHQLIKSISLT